MEKVSKYLRCTYILWSLELGEHHPFLFPNLCVFAWLGQLMVLVPHLSNKSATRFDSKQMKVSCKKTLYEQYLKQLPNRQNSNVIKEGFFCAAYFGCAHTSRVESSPILSSQTTNTRQWPCGLQWHCGIAYTPAELSRVPRILPSQKSWCRMFHFRQSHWVIGRDGRNGCSEAYSFS